MKKIENLRDYAIFLSQQKKQKNSEINIEDINNDKNNRKHQDHTYAKNCEVIKFWP